MDVTVVLDAKASLVGKDLSNVYRHFRSAAINNKGELPDNLPNARFKKKEDLDSTAKSLIKHKIKQLTGKSAPDIEQELGFNSNDGAGIPVEELRKVARLMILAASDQLPHIPEPEEPPKKADVVKKKKVEAAALTPSTPTRRATRKSLAPEMLRRDEKVDCRMKQETPQPEEQVVRDEDLGLGPNPTPQMVARKRRSMAVLNSSSATPTPSTIKPRRGSPQKATAPAASPAKQKQPVAVSRKNETSAANSRKNEASAAVSRKKPELVLEEEDEESEEMEVDIEPAVPSKKRKRDNQNQAAVEAALTAAKALNATASAIAAMANGDDDDEDEPAAKSAKHTPTTSKKRNSPKKQPRKSMLMSAVETLVKPLMPVVAAVPEPEPEPRPLKIGFAGADGCRIFIGQSQLTSFKAGTFTSKVKDFPGANMVVLHTPVTWDPTDVFSLVMAVKAMNRTCQVSTYTVLVGCGLSNVHLLREALYRQTRHVQFLVFERKDADLNHAKGKLREVNSYFLLAYFFEGCEQDPATHVVDVPAMVRPGATTNFRTESVEDLENQIVHTFTEKGDWVLDLFCDDRELSLAAQKSGRNAIAVHNRAEPLAGLKTKASAIACHFDTDFDVVQDGIIVQF